MERYVLTLDSYAFRLFAKILKATYAYLNHIDPNYLNSQELSLGLHKAANMQDVSLICLIRENPFLHSTYQATVDWGCESPSQRPSPGYATAYNCNDTKIKYMILLTMHYFIFEAFCRTKVYKKS